MYLVDREIRELLPDLELVCPHEDHPFEPDRQIQPCSVDLRLSNVFWKQTRRRRLHRRLAVGRPHAIDLRHAALRDLDPMRDWTEVQLDDGESLMIRPGEIVMGRVYERFRVPDRYAGKLEGRSSYARLGVSVHCTGDFVNPGWSGYMPLQLVNHGPYAIRIAPYLSVCQLMLVPLASRPDRTYGSDELDSKYRNDDGGPSLWWRDAGVKDVQRRLQEADLALHIQNEVVDTLRFEHPDVIERFQRYVHSRRVRDIQSTHALMGRFARRELLLQRFDRGAAVLLGLTFGGILSSVFVPFSGWHVVLTVVAVVCGAAVVGALARSDAGYLTPRRLREASSRPRSAS